MTRELTEMTLSEVWEWERARRAEIISADSDGIISPEVTDSLLAWVADSVADYLAAVDLDLLRKED